MLLLWSHLNHIDHASDVVHVNQQIYVNLVLASFLVDQQIYDSTQLCSKVIHASAMVLDIYVCITLCMSSFHYDPPYLRTCSRHGFTLISIGVSVIFKFCSIMAQRMVSCLCFDLVSSHMCFSLLNT